MFLVFILNPLRNFYFNGPYLNGWGGWEGMPKEDICAQITKVSSNLWKNLAIENCNLLLENKFQSFSVALYTFTYAWLLIKIFNYVWFRFLIFGPIMKEIKWFEENRKK